MCIRGCLFPTSRDRCFFASFPFLFCVSDPFLSGELKKTEKNGSFSNLTLAFSKTRSILLKLKSINNSF